MLGEKLDDASQAAIERSAATLARGLTRWSFLTRATAVAAAAAAAPVKTLLYPNVASAHAGCHGGCTGGLCCDGWTTFCCTINGGSNTCPACSAPGGWWKATYTGTGLCDAQNVRYYIDCNRHPSCSPCSAQCAGGNCNNRATCHNNFKYGQCNPGHPVTPVVCRVVTCVIPCNHPSYSSVCNCTVKEDPATANHQSSCL